MTSQVVDDDDDDDENDDDNGCDNDDNDGVLDWWWIDSHWLEIVDVSFVGLILGKDGDENMDDEEYNDGDVNDCDDVVVIACDVIEDVDVDDRIDSSMILAVFECLVCIVAVRL